MKRLALAIAMAWSLTGILIPPASAQDGGGLIIWSGGYRVEEGDEVNGDLIVLSGPVGVEEEGIVRGSLVAVQGDVSVAGTVAGDVIAALGQVGLGPSARVGGDVVSGVGRVHRSAGAQVGGQIQQGQGLSLRFGRIFAPPTVVFGRFPFVTPFGLGGFVNLVSVVLTLAALVALALVVIALWPAQVRTVGATALSSPGPSLGLGVVVGLLAIPSLLLLVVLVCTVPLAAILLAGLIGVFLYGWTALGLVVGERVLGAARRGDLSPLWAGGLGVALLSLIAAAPCFGFLFGLGAGAWGVGATLLSRFGTRFYPAAASASPAPARRVRRRARR